MSDIKFYMQRVDIPSQPPVDLEEHFNGMRYVSAKGIDDIGESRVYEETFAESDEVRVYIPKTPINKATKVEITFVFIGENRREVKDNFDEFIRVGQHKYWDTARNKSFIFYLKDKISVGEEKSKGSIKYIEVTYKLSNINGKTKKI